MAKSFDELKSFLAFLINKYFESEKNAYLKRKQEDCVFPVNLFEKEISPDFWQNVLSNYRVTDRCKCNQSDYNVCATVYLENEKGKDFFKDDYFLLNSNLGFFVFHIDSRGCLSECELLFEENIVPSFLFSLVKHFPSDNLENDELFLNEIKKRKIYSVEGLTGIFEIKQLNVIETD